MSKQQTNRLCQQIGHQWDADTVITNYRRCTRSECRVAQHLVRGIWRDVAVRTRPQATHQTVQPPLFRPGRDYYDKHEERRAELALLDLLKH